MTVRYEANPPKIVPGSDMEAETARFIGRIREVSSRCDAVHLTEDVLGHRRVSPVRAGRAAMEEIPGLAVTVSMRVRDKTWEEVERTVAECADAGFAGILVLMGDPSRDGRPDSGLVPSAVVSKLQKGAGPGMDLYLSVPSSPDYSRMGPKVRARPRGFVTQVVGSAGQVRGIAENLGEFDIIPIVLYPSEKNRRSAEFLGLDLDAYRRGFESMVAEIRGITGDVLVTSPSDFAGARGFLDSLEP